MNRCLQCMKEYDEQYGLCPYCGSEREIKPKELYFLTPGTLIAGRYEIGASVGNGGFGITYKAWDNTLSKVVAVKEYYPAGLVNRVPGEKNIIIYSGSRQKECTNGKVRFLEEARNMAKFNTHPNIINVYDFFEENNTAYIVMEFLDGENYKDYIREQGGKVPLDKALEVSRAVLSALKEVHESGILHRDISPDNIFMCRDGHIKLIDFGAARFSAKDEDKTRSIILKPGFAPPEQYQSKSRQGPWTDIYAVGATLYRAITGNVPEESVNRVEEDLLTEPEKFCPELSHNLNNAILRAMALQYELRFQSAEEFSSALLGEIEIRNVSRELKKRKVRRFISIAAVSAAAAIGTIICLKVVEQRKIAAAILEPADISVWICADSQESVQEKTELFETALEEFKQEYPQIGVEVQCMEAQAYETRLREALEQGNPPTLFDSSCLSTEDYEYLEEVSDVFGYIRTGDYYFLDRYERFFPHKKQLPLAFCMPVAYCNTIVNAEKKDVEELVEEENFLVSAEGYFTWYNLYGDKEQLLDFQDLQSAYPDEERIADKELFGENKIGCMIADTSLYEWVQGSMPGIYDIYMFEDAGMTGAFRDYYSISREASAEEKEAAVQVLVYLLADTAQDTCYVQNGIYLPLNKDVYAAYVDINREFKDLDKGFGKVIMPGENQALLDKWYEEIKSGQ